MDKYYVVADVGGTNISFALVGIKGKSFKIVAKEVYSTKRFASFCEIIDIFLNFCAKEYNVTPESAVFAVAGIVKNDRAKLTNADLVVDIKEIVKKTLLKDVRIFNDFIAVAYGVEMLKDKDLLVVNEGDMKERRNKCVLGAGTGLGQSILVYDEKIEDYFAIPSEMGHGDFPLDGKEEYELVEFIRKRRNLEKVEWEDLISGRGIEDIYSFLQSSEKEFSKCPKSLVAKEISESKTRNLCSKKALEYFFRFYARVAKNFALQTLARGGVYIGGGIIGKNYKFSKKVFVEEFLRNDKMGAFLKSVPVFVIKNYGVSILGLGNYIVKRLVI